MNNKRFPCALCGANTIPMNYYSRKCKNCNHVMLRHGFKYTKNTCNTEYLGDWITKPAPYSLIKHRPQIEPPNEFRDWFNDYKRKQRVKVGVE